VSVTGWYIAKTLAKLMTVGSMYHAVFTDG